MINVKKLLNEERSSESAPMGCLMAMFPKEMSEKILLFGKKIISEDDLYTEGNEFGREKEGHVTIRYGFTKDLTELDVRRLLEGQKPFTIELYGLDQFKGQPNNIEGAKTQPYDVVFLKAKSPILEKLNEETKKFPHKDTYGGVYRPHSTLAYVQPGKFPLESREGFRIPVLVKTLCYSPISGGKSYFDL